MIRYHRMKGYSAMGAGRTMPGSPHSSVEKALAKEGLSREQIGREEFLRRTWAWKEKYGGIITRQIRRLGASAIGRASASPLERRAFRAPCARLSCACTRKGCYRGPRLNKLVARAEDGLYRTWKWNILRKQAHCTISSIVLSDNPQDILPVATTRRGDDPGRYAVREYIARD